MHKQKFDEEYVSGTGQNIVVHRVKDCKGKHCVIHNPSFHKMNGWPTHWRGDRYLMERICQHGVGHPDPDHIAFAKDANDTSHGCDGCCRGSY